MPLFYLRKVYYKNDEQLVSIDESVTSVIKTFKDFLYIYLTFLNTPDHIDRYLKSLI